MTRQKLAERVIEAARKVAVAANDLADEACDSDEIWEMPAAISITAGDLRDLRAALADYDGAPDDGAQQVVEAARQYVSTRDSAGHLDPALFHKLDAAITHLDRNSDVAPDDDGWRPIETAPMSKVNERPQRILLAFYGQFGWEIFIDSALGANSGVPRYANPTHWRPLPPPPRKETP